MRWVGREIRHEVIPPITHLVDVTRLLVGVIFGVCS
jgi:hypothetical protein